MILLVFFLSLREIKKNKTRKRKSKMFHDIWWQFKQQRIIFIDTITKKFALDASSDTSMTIDRVDSVPKTFKLQSACRWRYIKIGRQML